MLYTFAKFGFIMLFSALAASFAPPELGAGLGLVFAVAGCVFWAAFKKLGAARLVCFAAAAGALLVAAELGLDYYPQKALGGLSADITGRVTEISAEKGRPVYTVKTDSVSVDGAPQKITFKLTDLGESNAAVYDEISAHVTFFTPVEEEISDLLTDRTRGIMLYAYMNSPMETTGEFRKFPEYTLFSVRERLSAAVSENFSGWRAAFTSELLFGKGDVSPEVKDLFRFAGMSHILAVSGMHLVVVTGLLESLIFGNGKGGDYNPVRIFIMAAVTVAYMAAAGFGMSVLRAGFMLLAGYAARLVWVKSQPIDNLGLSIAAVLLIDPLACCDVGFLMSALSSGGIILLSPPLYEKLAGNAENKRPKVLCALAQAFAVGVAAWAATLPVAIFAFGGASLMAPFSNIFAGPLSQWAVSFGVFSVAAALIPYGSVLAMVFASAAQFCEELLLLTAKLFGSLPFSYMYVDEGWVKLWVAGAAALLALPFAAKKTQYLKHAALMAALSFLCGALCQSAIYSGTVSTKLVALENGTAICLEKDGSPVVLAKGLTYGDRYKLGGNGKGADVFISMGADTSPIETELSEKLAAKTVLLSSAENAKRVPGALPVAAGKALFWDGAFVKIIPGKALEIDTGGILILYIFGECDIIEIEPRFRRADIVIFEGVSPEDYPALRCRYAVLKRNGSFSNPAGETLVLEKGESFFVSRGKNIKKGWAFG